MKPFLITLTLALAIVMSVEGQVRLPVRGRGPIGGGGGGASSVIAEANINWDCGVANGCGIAILPLQLSDTSMTASSQSGALPGYHSNEGLYYYNGHFFTTADALHSRFGVGGGAPGIVTNLFSFDCDTLVEPATVDDVTAPDIMATCAEVQVYGDATGGKSAAIDDSQPHSDQYYAGVHSLLLENGNVWATWSASPYDNTGSCGGCPDNVASVSKATLNATSTTGVAAYKFGDGSGTGGEYDFKLRTGSLIPIPSQYQASLGNKTHLLLGNGSFSGGGFSYDLSAIAITLPTGANLSEVPSTDFKILLKRDVSECTNTSDARQPRPAWLPDLLFNYTDGNNRYLESSHCTPSSTAWGTGNANGIEWQTLTDFPGNCIWPYLNGLSGIVCFGGFTVAGTDYIAAVTGAAGFTNGVRVYDPDDFVAVYAGNMNASDVFQATSWEHIFPGFKTSDTPFTPLFETAATVNAIAATDRVRFTFSPSVPSWMAEDVAFSVYGNATFNGSYTIADGGMVNSTTIDTCTAQNRDACLSQADIVANIGPEVNVTLAGFLGALQFYGIAVGAVWMPSNSGCAGKDNMIAVLYDVPYYPDTRYVFRYLQCGRLEQ